MCIRDRDYLACAPLPKGGALPSGVVLPATVEVHLSKPHGQLQSHVLADRIPNSRTDIDLIGRDEEAGVGLYHLRPHSGRTHQLRAHLACCLLYTSTYGTIKAKQAVKDAARVMGHPFAMGDRLTKVMPADVMGLSLIHI